MACAVTTGGYNLTKARADAMVEAGVQSVSVSIDGLEASHDLVRNRPQSWRRAFAALSHLRGAGARIACNTQINQRSRHELLPLAELLAEAGVRAWQLQITVAHGNAADHPELLLQPYMIPELFDGLVASSIAATSSASPSGPPTTSATSARSSTASRRLGGHFGAATPAAGDHRHRERRRDQELPQPGRRRQHRR
jgi:hypothetical protein